MRKSIAATLVLLASLSLRVRGGPRPVLAKGYLEVDARHAAWPSPGLLVKDLQSPDQAVRLKALNLLGVHRTRVKAWSQGSPSRVIGEQVITPDAVQLTYAALGSGPTRDAIVAVDLEQTQTVMVGVAVPRPSGWEEIALSSCWCKYDMYIGRDVLAKTVQIRPAPGNQPPTERYELVLRASGGGTDIYTQDEGHFRVRQGELHSVLAFQSRRLQCPSTSPRRPCSLERRWFYVTAFGKVFGGVLVSAQGSFPQTGQRPYEWILRQIQYRHLKTFSCATYEWNDKKFRYEPFNDKLSGPYGDPCVLPRNRAHR